MDRCGLVSILPTQLRVGNIICKEDWAHDLKVLEITPGLIYKVKVVGICSDIEGEQVIEYVPGEDILVVK